MTCNIQTAVAYDTHMSLTLEAHGMIHCTDISSDDVLWHIGPTNYTDTTEEIYYANRIPYGMLVMSTTVLDLHVQFDIFTITLILGYSRWANIALTYTAMGAYFINTQSKCKLFVDEIIYRFNTLKISLVNHSQQKYSQKVF